MKFIIVRHGTTEWNKLGKSTGTTDIDLNDLGVEEAKKISSFLKKENINHILCSPLKRTKKTAQIINKYHNKNLDIVDYLKEFDVGELTGLTKKEIKNRYPWVNKLNENHRKELGMESISEWVENFKNQIIPKLIESYENETILIITHKWKIITLLTALGYDLNLFIENPPLTASISKIEIEKDLISKLLFYNKTL